jgi:hypothetical protein
MFTNQYALNSDGSLKDAKDIKWSYNKDNKQPLPRLRVPFTVNAQAVQPLTSTATPATATPAQPLGYGLCNKATTWFLDAIAHEQLSSDGKDPNTFVKPPRCKCAAQPARTPQPPPTLSSSNSFVVLPVEEPSDNENDGTFQTESGSESDVNSSDGSMDLELISNNEV